MSDWIKSYSKTYKKDYWFNSKTGEKSWTEPSALVPSDLPSLTISNSSSLIEDKKREREDNIELSAAKKACGNISIERVAIIVPYQDAHVEQKRRAQLNRFAPTMNSFLKHSEKDYKIFIIEQDIDDRKFNRGMLLNIGFDLACKENYSIFIFHDVDLIPSEELLPYYCSLPLSPVHIARVWNRYNVNDKYFGGIVAFSEKDFRDINGFPNHFWGWGGEDDALITRVNEIGLKITFPTTGHITDMEEMDLQQKLDFLRAHKEWKCADKWEALEDDKKSWRTDGLSNLHYDVLGVEDLRSSTVKYTVKLI